jgi:branched-chain amino acid transport system permease protein
MRNGLSMIEAYFVHLLILTLIYVILALSLNLTLGYSGMVNLGHIALYGIGAYTSALLTTKLGFPFFLAFIIAGIISALFGFILIFATRKLKGDYFVLSTLGFSFVINSLLLNLEFTNRAFGVAGIPRPYFFGQMIISNNIYLIFTIIITAIVVFVLYKIINSPFGRLLHALRDDEIGLKVLGKNTSKLKIKAMILSSFFAGIAGSLFAHYISYIDPSSFMTNELILLLSIVIVGGIASIKGSIISPFIFIFILDGIRFFSLPDSILGPMRLILYSLILLIILYVRPRGLFGKIDLV